MRLNALRRMGDALAMKASLKNFLHAKSPLAAVIWLCWHLSACTLTPQIPDGIYWAKSIQEYLLIEGRQFRSYQWNEFSCVPSISGLIPSVGVVDSQFGQLELLSYSADSMDFTRLSDGLPVHFAKADKLPMNCHSETVSSAISLWYSLQSTLQAFGLTLTREQRQLLPKVSDIDKVIDDGNLSQLQLFQLFAKLLAGFNDNHAFLYSRELGQFWSNVQSSAPASLPEATGFCNDAIRLSSLGKAVWLKIARLHSFDKEVTYAGHGHKCLNRLAQTLTQLSDKTDMELVVDLRGNSGGSLIYAADLAAMLGVRPNPVLSYVNGLAVNTPRHYQPLQGFQKSTLLIDKGTASAAEHLALALKNSGFLVAGSASAGSFSPAIVKTLPNGWFYGFSMFYRIKDSQGKPVPEQAGIQVDCYDPDPGYSITCYPMRSH